jgi:hypothetical protein
MPVITASGGISPGSFGVTVSDVGVANLSTGQVTSAPSDNVVDRGGSVGPALLRLTTTVGATPTCTYLVEGSASGTIWFPIQNADSATPQTLVITTFVITTAGTFFRLIPALIPVRFLRVTYSANTNVTNTLDAFIY